MIKNYLELSKSENERFMEFINRNKEIKLSFEEVHKQFISDEYDFGRGVILKTNGENIAAKVLVILKECNKKGIAYITNLEINEKVENQNLVFLEIIESAKNISKEYGAKKIYFGTKDHKLIEILTSLNLEKQYSAIKMILNDRKIKYSTLDLTPLSEINKNQYLMIFNDAFENVPNGATLIKNEIDEYIQKADKNNSYYLASINNEIIGFLQFEINDNIGMFDLGLIKAARGKGYGNMLLETAINFLNTKEVTKISLIVMTSNTLAYNLYIKRGFKESNLLCDWFEL